MSDLIRVKRGLKANLPELMQGEFGYCTDTQELFIGGLDGNVEVGRTDYVSVKKYGAKGDGVADDTLAIQAAIDATPIDGMVLFPYGDYRTTGKLSINKNMKVLGFGRIVADFSTANTDIIEIGPSGETRVGVEIKGLRLAFKNANCRHGIYVSANTSHLKIEYIDFRSYGDAYIFCTGSGIHFNGNGLPTGLNDWAEFCHNYIAYCFNGITVDAANVINCRIAQNTVTLSQDRGIKWLRGGQSQITSNTFQNCCVVNPSGAVYIDGGTLANSVSNNVTIGPANSFQNNGVAGAGSSEIELANCRSIHIIGNQMQSVNPTGAYRAIKTFNALGITISQNSFQAYTKGTTPGAVEIPADSSASYYDNQVVSGFEIAVGSGIINPFVGTTSIKNAAGSEIFRFDVDTQVATLKAANIAGTHIGIFEVGGAVQMSGGVKTIENPKALNACKFFLSAATTKGALQVVSITDGVGFTVNSVDDTGAVITDDNGWFYWMFMG